MQARAKVKMIDQISVEYNSPIAIEATHITKVAGANAMIVKCRANRTPITKLTVESQIIV